MSLCDRCKNKCKFMLKNKTLDTCSLFEKQTNFDRITASPEALAELIADAMFLYSTNRHIFTIEAIKMASKKEKIDINLDCNYKDVVKWLNEESKE